MGGIWLALGFSEDAAAVLEPLLEAIGPIENFDKVEVFLFGL